MTTARVDLRDNDVALGVSGNHAENLKAIERRLGVRPERQRILVVKAAIAYKAAYLPVAGTVIEADTPGLTAINPARLPYRHARLITGS